MTFVGYAFVDDTDLGSTSSDRNATGEMVADMLQSAVTDWEGGIRATGGAIVPDKTHWYLVDFKWVRGQWHYASDTETPATLQVKDSTGTLRTLKRLAPHDAERTLGV